MKVIKCGNKECDSKVIHWSFEDECNGDELECLCNWCDLAEEIGGQE